MTWIRWWYVLSHRSRSIFRRAIVERDLNRELDFHLHRQILENVARGMTMEDAGRSAVRALDGVTTIQEECRDMRRVNLIDTLFQDLRYALRGMKRNPGFATILVLTLALAIGASSAIFSVIDGVLIQALPYPQPNRLVRIFFSSATYPKFPLNPWDFHDFRDRNRSFESMAAYMHRDVQLSGAGEPVRLSSIRTTANFFAVLGFKPVLGREFTRTDELPSSAPVAIISDRLWRERFSANPAILGKSILLDGTPVMVVGLMPHGVEHPGNEYRALPHGESVDVWLPFSFSGNPSARGSHFLDAIARLKPGVTPQQALSEMQLLTAQLIREHPKMNGWHALVLPLYDEIVGRSQKLLLILLGAVGMVLLIACVNAANLLLARSAARRQEMAVRGAIGAGRSRLLRQVLTESLMIAVASAVAGSACAVGGVRLLVALLPADFPRIHAIHLNAGVFAFTLGISLAASLLFGLAPALEASRIAPHEALREGGRTSTGGRRSLRLRSALVVSEIGLASALLIGAGLLLRSFVNLTRSDPGFRADHVLTVRLALTPAQYKGSADIARFYDRLVADLSELPGIQTAGASTDIPWTGANDNTDFSVEGRAGPNDDRPHARYHSATPDYFKAMGIPLLEGRFPSERDGADAPPVIVINQAMARKIWPHESAVGKRVTFDQPPKWTTVVGVVGDVKDAPNSTAAEPAYWWVEAQAPISYAMTVAVRGNSDPGTLLSEVEHTVHSLDASLAISGVRTMDQIASEAFSTPRFSMALVGLFASIALILAAIGMYGVIAYSVSQRTHEFGLRMALGANARQVHFCVLAHGMRLAAVGVAVGLGSALILSNVLRSLLYEVGSTDAATFAAVAIISIAVASFACYIPAHRATQADPMTALRCD